MDATGGAALGQDQQGTAGRVAGRVALVTGGARGMGAAHARALVAEGARVVVADVLDEQGEALVAELGGAGRFVRLDVTSEADWTAAVETTTSVFGGLDVLVNNAGIVNGGGLADFDLGEWQRILDVNLTGTFLGIRACTPALTEAARARGDASIVNISSVEGLRGSPWAHGYVATKWAVRGLTKSVALDLAGQGVRCNSVHPGLIRTPMTQGFPDDILTVPLGRPGRAEEVAAFVVFLASRESSYATGAEFVVDGGCVQAVPHG